MQSPPGARKKEGIRAGAASGGTHEPAQNTKVSTSGVELVQWSRGVLEASAKAKRWHYGIPSLAEPFYFGKNYSRAQQFLQTQEVQVLLPRMSEYRNGSEKSLQSEPIMERGLRNAKRLLEISAQDLAAQFQLSQ